MERETLYILNKTKESLNNSFDKKINIQNMSTVKEITTSDSTTTQQNQDKAVSNPSLNLKQKRRNLKIEKQFWQDPTSNRHYVITQDG